METPEEEFIEMRSSSVAREHGRKKQKGSLIAAVCNLLGTLIILLVIAFCLSLILPGYFGYEVYNVVSGSMEPEIPVGSMIYVQKSEPEDIKAGDIIAFRSGDSVVVHRVTENQIVMGEFTTKGDANEVEDFNTVAYDALIGLVAYHLPRVGQFMMIYTSSVGKLYVLGFAICGLLFHVLAGRLRKNQRDNAAA